MTESAFEELAKLSIAFLAGKHEKILRLVLTDTADKALDFVMIGWSLNTIWTEAPPRRR